MPDAAIRVAIGLLGVIVLAVVVGAAVLTGGAAAAQLRDADGNFIGTAVFTENPDGVRVVLLAQGLEPGEHGIHIHEKGDCSSSDFMSAGAHFNPAGAEHGLENPNGPHAGDLPNITVNENGAAAYQATTDRVTLSEGRMSLFDSDGSAFVIHANADDQRTDPSGGSGSRVACGVIRR